jgi:uncharacterized protein (TIGR02231 family)
MADATIAHVPVVEVTLLEDRAIVRREATITLPAGIDRVRIEGVAPVLVDKTLAGEFLDASGDMRVRDVHVRRQRVTEDRQRPAEVAELAAAVRDRTAQLQQTQRSTTQIENDLAAQRGLVALTLGEVGEDTGWARFDATAAGAELDRIDAELDALVVRRAEGRARATELERELADLRRHAAELAGADRHATAVLDVHFGPAPDVPTEVTLRVEYMVPGAQWRPWHTARLHEPADGPPRVHLSAEGCVWQATGEDWVDVQLVLSTDRPSLGTRPPPLITDRLTMRKRGSTVQVQTRDQKIHTAGLGSERAEEEADELPGIDDGGETLQLRAPSRASIPSDGRPHRVPLFAGESEAELALVCMPELAAAVMLRTRQVNPARHPLLAGPVDLVRNSGRVGRTSTLFVAPGERFELGWGPDPALRVHRSVERLDEDRRTMSAWTRKPRRVDIKLSNLGAAPRRVEVSERIAVSEIEKVEVELVEATHRATPDADGILTWPVDLKGYGRGEVSVTWTLVVHDDVHGL